MDRSTGREASRPGCPRKGMSRDAFRSAPSSPCGGPAMSAPTRRAARRRGRRVRLDGPGAHPGLRPGAAPLPAAAARAAAGRRSPTRCPAGRRRPRRSSASPTATRDWREHRRRPDRAGGQHRRAELPAQGDRRRDGAGRQAHLDREAGRADHRRCARRSPTRSRAAGVQSTVGFNYRNAPAVAAARELIAVRRARHHHPRPVPAVQRLRRAPGGRAELALRAGARRQRGARRPRLARRRPGLATCSATSTRWSPTPRPSSPSGPGRPAPPAAMPGRPAAKWVRWRTRTTSPACCASPPAPAAPWRPAGSPSASRTTTASRSTAPRARCSGTSAGWANSGSASAPPTRTSRSAPSTSAPPHGDYAAFQPGSANSMGYDDLKVIEAYNFLRSIAEGKPYGSTLDDAVRSAVALDAMAESAANGQLGVAADDRPGRRDRRRHHGRRSREHPAPHGVRCGGHAWSPTSTSARAQGVAGQLPGARATGDALRADRRRRGRRRGDRLARLDPSPSWCSPRSRAGKPVLCEKPLAPTLAECVEVVRRGSGGRRRPACR